MKLINTAIAFILFLLLFSGCNSDKKIVIGGSYEEGAGRYLYLTRIDIDIPVFIDSVKISKKGTFETRFDYNQPAFYNFGFNNSDFITLIAYPGDKIFLTCTGESFYGNYSIEGSPESEDLKQLDSKLANTTASLDSLQIIYESLPENDNERKAGIEKQYTELVKAQRLYNIGYILDNLNSFASIKALFQRINDDAYVLYKPTDAQYLKLVSDTLNKYYPGSKQAINLANNLENELSALNISRISDMVANSEITNLDIDLKDISGKNRKLSSLEGKNYVLLSFWSARIEECVSNNLQLKEYYNLYHKKGLEIYQVSLDEDEELWKAAIAYDELPWISVRDSDTTKISPAVQYNITRLPANYLIDMKGEIIGKDLFGRTLQIKLSQLFD
jgi:peroxiredoxin